MATMAEDDVKGFLVEIPVEEQQRLQLMSATTGQSTRGIMRREDNYSTFA
jgi:hypothetical protein